MEEIFKPVTPRRISEEIVEQIKSLIFDGTLKPGERLLPERQLAKRLNVSRASLREALNSLQEMGLLEIEQRNRTFVRPITTRSLNDPLLAFLNSSPSNLANLLEVRKFLEIGSTSLAAERATAADIEKLEKILGVMEEDIRRNRLGAHADTTFHITLGEATRNRLYIHIIHTIYDLLQEQLRYAWGGIFRKRDERQKLLQQHYEILEAIKEHNPEKGREQAMRHFDYVAEVWSNPLASTPTNQESKNKPSSTNQY